MKLKTVEHIIEQIDKSKDFYPAYIDLCDIKGVPFKLDKDISKYLVKILSTGNKEKIIASLFLISKFQKEKDFNYDPLKKFLINRDYQISYQAIQSFKNSESKKAQEILLEYITNPKSDSLGEDAVDVIAKNSLPEELIEKLINIYPALKRQTKASVEYLIYRNSFRKDLLANKSLREFINLKKMNSTEKYKFKNWKKLTEDKIEFELSKWIQNILSNPIIKSNTSKKFYVIESTYYFSMYRLVVGHIPNTYVTFQLGLHPLMDHGWGIKHIEFGLQFNKQIDYSGIEEFNKCYKDEIRKWKEFVKKEIQILENSNLDVIQQKSELIYSSTSTNIHTYAGYLNWLCYLGNKNEMLMIAHKALNDKFLELNETWIEYFKNIENVTITSLDL